jgi:hypothetical protein
MSLKQPIRASEIVRDIRSGMTDGELTEKYGLSPRRLQKVFQKLLEAEAIGKDELYAKSPLFRRRIDDFKDRAARRVELSIPLWVYEVESARQGLVRDISEIGMRVAGIKAATGEEKIFQLPVDIFFSFDPALFTVRCIWTHAKGKLLEYWVGGYEIIRISDGHRDVLRKLVSMLLLSGSGEWSTL